MKKKILRMYCIVLALVFMFCMSELYVWAEDGTFANETESSRNDKGEFVEKEGLVVIEAEAGTLSKQWVLGTSMKGYYGNGYITWTGEELFQEPGEGIIPYTINITKPGKYFLALHNRHDFEDETLQNDVWIKMDKGDWNKIFSSENKKWTWHTVAEYSHDNKVKPVYELEEGIHTLLMSARSRNFSIDRLRLEFIEPLDGGVKKNTGIVAAEQIFNLNKIIGDSSTWIKANGAEIDFTENKMIITGGDSIVSYPAREFGDKLLEFTFKPDISPNNTNICAIHIKNTHDSKFVWKDNGSSYFIWIKPDKVELQRFVSGIGKILFEDQITLNQSLREYKVQFGAIPLDEGTRLLLRVDGETIYDVIDEGVKLDAEDSYLTIYNLKNKITIGGAESESSNPDTGDSGILVFAVVTIGCMISVLFLTIKKKKIIE